MVRMKNERRNLVLECVYYGSVMVYLKVEVERWRRKQVFLHNSHMKRDPPRKKHISSNSPLSLLLLYGFFFIKNKWVKFWNVMGVWVFMEGCCYMCEKEKCNIIWMMNMREWRYDEGRRNNLFKKSLFLTLSFYSLFWESDAWEIKGNIIVISPAPFIFFVLCLKW